MRSWLIECILSDTGRFAYAGYHVVLHLHNAATWSKRRSSELRGCSHRVGPRCIFLLHRRGPLHETWITSPQTHCNSASFECNDSFREDLDRIIEYMRAPLLWTTGTESATKTFSMQFLGLQCVLQMQMCQVWRQEDHLVGVVWLSYQVILVPSTQRNATSPAWL